MRGHRRWMVAENYRTAIAPTWRGREESGSLRSPSQPVSRSSAFDVGSDAHLFQYSPRIGCEAIAKTRRLGPALSGQNAFYALGFPIQASEKDSTLHPPPQKKN